jgi:two-component system response regulator GlrR
LAMASGGTLFLDEIGELPLRLQVKLLGVLDRGAVTPVGGTQSQPVDLRVVAATNRDLAREVNEGRFRADLFYRLAVARLRVPPLRERLDDLPLLVGAALERLRARGNQGVPTELPAIAMARLAGQPWPGNVRELFNAVERAMVALESEPLARPPAAHLEAYQAARDRFVDDFQRSFLEEALRRNNGQVTAAARAAGVEQRYFRRLVARHGLVPASNRRR